MSELSPFSSWPVVRMADIAAKRQHAMAIGPFGSDLKTSDYRESGVPIVFVRDVQPNAFCPKQRKFVSQEKARKLAAHSVLPGDLVITKMGLPPCVAAVYPQTEAPGIVTADIIKVSLDEAIAHRDYVALYMNTDMARSQVAEITFGITRPKVTLRDFREMQIPLPPLPEQRRIADILDRAEALRAQRRAAIAQLDELTQAIFVDMFGDVDTHLNARQLPKGWKVDTVADICAPRPYSCVGGPFGSELTQADYVDAPGVPVVRGQNLSSNGMFIFEEGFVYVSESKANELHRNTAERGDVMVSQRGARLAGQVAYIPLTSRFPKYVVSQSQMKISPDLNRVHPFYLVHYFQSPQAIRRMEAQTISTGVPHINLGILRRFMVVVPPLELQNGFAARVTAVGKLRSAHHSSLVELDALFATLQDRAFRGEL